MSANDIFVGVTDFLCENFYPAKVRKYLRPFGDLRLVSYHGIGMGTGPCFRYINDEISVSAFENQIDYLSKNYTILPFQDCVEIVNNKKKYSDLPLCAITFDDGLKSVYTEALGVLNAKNIKSTVFINTSVVDNNAMLWIHSINYFISTIGISKLVKIINILKDENMLSPPENVQKIFQWAKLNYEMIYEANIIENIFNYLDLSVHRVAKEQNLYLDWNDIYEMNNDGHFFCSHTHNHSPLSRFSNLKNIESDIKESFSIIKNNCQCTEFVSFPFGMRDDYGQYAVNVAFESGHKYIVEVGTGANDPKKNIHDKIYSRVSLGEISDTCPRLFSALELRPFIKQLLRK